MKNPEALSTNNETIYAHFIFELLELLSGILGLVPRCNKLYELDVLRSEFKEIIKIFTEVKHISIRDELPPTPKRKQEPPENSSDLDASNQMNSEEGGQTSDHLDESVALIFASIMIDKFAGVDGFKKLLNIIYPDTKESELDDKGTETATESESSPVKRQQVNNGDGVAPENAVQLENVTIVTPKTSRAICPWVLIDKIVRIFELLDGKLLGEVRFEMLAELSQRIAKRFQNIRDKEIKELDIDLVKRVFERLETIVLRNYSPENPKYMNFYEFREKSELELYFRFLDGQSFEKKLRGLNGIKEYANKLEIEEGPQLDDARAAKKKLTYFTPELLVKWLLESKVIEIIYEKHTHIELIKRSVDLLRFITQNCESFPDKLINTIWNSSLDKHEDVVKVIYERIIELGPELDIDAAQKMYQKFLTVRVEDYTEDFIDLICRFTKNCLNLVVKRDEEGNFKTLDVTEDQKKYHYFGVPFIFNLVMDNSPLELDLSQRVLLYLQDIISEFPVPNIFVSIINECLENLAQDRSVYQSLVVMKRFLMTIRDIVAYQTFCDVYFAKIARDHNLIDDLVKDITEYWQKVQERMRTYRGAMKDEVTKEEGLIEESFVGKFSHKKNIFERLYALRDFALYIYPDSLLDTIQVKSLWRVFVLEPNFVFETNEFLRMISMIYNVNGKMILLIKIDDLKSVLLEILCNEEMLIIDQLTIDKFNCLEFFFLCVNMTQSKILVDQKESKGDLAINSNEVEVVDHDLYGLDFLWKCLERCPDSFLVEQFTGLLVNIYTRFHQSLHQRAQEIHQKLVSDLIESIRRFLDERNVRGIERFIQFLGRFLDKVDGRREATFPRQAFNASNFQNQAHKISMEVVYDPYQVSKKFDFFKKERVGAVKESLAKNFEVESADFDLFIDDTMMQDDDLFKEVKEMYTGNPQVVSAKMIKREPRPIEEDPKYLITRDKNSLDIFFNIFSTIQPEKLKAVWDFTQKLPLQEDMKREFFERRDFTQILEGESSLSDSNIYKFYYYLSLINNLSIIDPYFSKMYLKFDYFELMITLENILMCKQSRQNGQPNSLLAEASIIWLL